MPVPQMQTQETSYKPWGLTAGAMVGQQQYDQEQANQLALQESQLGNVIKSVEAGRAQADYSNPEMEQLRQAGIMGKDKTASATGEYDQGVLKSKLEKGIAENIAGKSAAQIEQGLNSDFQTLQGLRKAQAFLESPTAQNPAYVAEAFQRFGKELGIDPRMQQQLMQQEQQRPGTIKELVKTLIPQLEYGITHTRASMAKMAEQDANNKSQGQWITGPTNTTTLEAHRMDNASREKVAAMNAAQLKENTRAINDAKDENARTNLMNHLNGQEAKINTRIEEIEVKHQNVQPQSFRGELVNGKPLSKEEVSRRVTAARAKLEKEREDAIKLRDAIQKQRDDIFSKSKFAPAPSMFPGDEDAMAADLAGQQPALPPGVTIKR